MVNVALYNRGNDALNSNPPAGVDYHITTHGSDWDWAVFALFSFCMVLYIGTSYLKPRQERLFHYSTIFGLFCMSIAYYTMASDLGWAPSQAEFNHITVSDPSMVPGTRQIFYAHYIGWFLGWPTIVINLGVLAGVDIYNLLFTIAASWIFDVCLLIGTLIHSTYKWGYFVFGVVGFLLLAYNLVVPFRRAASEVNTLVSKRLNLFAPSAAFIWMLYPLAWALSDGGNVIQPDSAAVFFGVLDLVLFIFIGSAFLLSVRTLSFEELGLNNGETKPVFHKFIEKTELTRPSGETVQPPEIV